MFGAAINAFALTALVKMDIREFLLQELFLILVWAIIIGLEGFFKKFIIYKSFKSSTLTFDTISHQNSPIVVIKNLILEVSVHIDRG